MTGCTREPTFLRVLSSGHQVMRSSRNFGQMPLNFCVAPESIRTGGQMFQDFIAAQAKVLAHVAAADGQIDAQEREHFVGFLEASPISDALRVELYELLRTPPSLAETESLISGIPPEAASTLLKSAYLIAHANGHLADTEVRSLDRLAMAAGVPSASLPKLHRMLELTLDAHRLEREIFSI